MELLGKIRETLNDGKRGEIIRQGIKLAIFGPPNAGKSTLLNFFGVISFPSLSLLVGATDAICEAQREAAIVTAVPGTTRDVLEISLDIEGLPVVIADTAGLRAAGDVVERIGIQRAAEAYVLYCGPLWSLRSYNGCANLQGQGRRCLTLCDIVIGHKGRREGPTGGGAVGHSEYHLPAQ